MINFLFRFPLFNYFSLKRKAQLPWYFILLSCFVLLSNKGYSQECLPEGLTINNQGDITNFINQHSDCTEILGDVMIQVTNLGNLQFMSQIEKIHGSLTIQSCHSLENFAGFENLKLIGEDLQIFGNFNLASLYGLNHLDRIGRHFIILNNDLLSSLAGCNNLRIVEGEILIDGNKILSSLAGLSSIEEIGGLTLWSSNAFIDFSGMENIEVINSDLEVLACEIESFNGLENLQVINGNLVIGLCQNIKNLEGLSALHTIGQNFNLLENPRLSTVTGLNNLKRITKSCVIYDNDSLQNLHALRNLNFVGATLLIDRNDLLTNLEGFEGLNGTGLEELQIHINNNLVSLTGLESIKLNSLSRLSIKYNPLLSDCAISNLCDHLANCGTSDICNNASGCISTFEISKACRADPEIDYNFNCNVQVYPNPGDNYLNISIDGRDFLGVEYEIYDHLGQKISSYTKWETDEIDRLDIQSLSAGIYYLKMTSWKFSRTVRFIKK